MFTAAARLWLDAVAAPPRHRLRVEAMLGRRQHPWRQSRCAPPAPVTARLDAVIGREPAQRAGRIQGANYLLGGLWRLLHPRSFERVAGPKPDQFQTDVSAALFTAAGAALIAGTLNGAPQGPARVLAIGAPVAVAVVDVRHRRQIRGLFRLEAALEIGFAAAAAIPPRRPS